MGAKNSWKINNVFLLGTLLFVVTCWSWLPGCVGHPDPGKCSFPCTLEHDPVCLVDGKHPPKLFGNPCQVEVFKCGLKGKHRLNVVDLSKCTTVKEVSPRELPCDTCESDSRLGTLICAGNHAKFETFDNACLMARENCVHEYRGGARFRFIHEGPCTGDEVLELMEGNEEDPGV